MAVPWRLAKSLVVLRSEVRSVHPGTTFWTIGDQDHASGWSDHNRNADDVVCAADVLGDGGLDLQAFADHLVRRPHRALKYVIFNRRIWSKSRASEGWRPYYGSNPHRTHVHVSVGVGPDGRSTGPYDDTSPWGIASMGRASLPTSSRVAQPTLREGDEGPEVGRLQANLNDALDMDLAEDGQYGPNTTGGVKLLQRRAGIAEDGIYGPDSAGALRDLLEDDMPTADEIADAVWSIDKPSPVTGDRKGMHVFVRYTHKAVADMRAATLRVEAGQRAILAAVEGLDTEAVLARIDQRSAEDAERDAALLDQVQSLASGGATAQDIVDEIAVRLTGAGE